jgi:RND family efflux transporter MFP subunit
MSMSHDSVFRSRAVVSLLLLTVFAPIGCTKAAPPPPAMHAMPVKVEAIGMAPVPRSDEYVATIKSRQSATIQPQVDGNIVKIYVHSGDHVKPGQVLMEIDPLKQKASLASQEATEQQKLATYNYNKIEVERQRKLFAEGVVSRDAMEQAEEAYNNSKSDYESSVASTTTQKQQLGYYHLSAPFDGIVGDIPVHLGDYVSPTTTLTTVDANDQLEAYIYIPAERAADVRFGLPVQLMDNSGNDLEDTKIYFVSPQVDNQLQGILVKTPVSSKEKLRNLQLVTARVIWDVKPSTVVPVLAINRIGDQAFVYVAEPSGQGYVAKQRAITLGETVGNTYNVLSGLKIGDKVIVSGTQFLIDGAPVQPLG